MEIDKENRGIVLFILVFLFKLEVFYLFFDQVLVCVCVIIYTGVNWKRVLWNVCVCVLVCEVRNTNRGFFCDEDNGWRVLVCEVRDLLCMLVCVECSVLV